MRTDISKLLGIKYPILQGAMATISDASLVSAVSNAGGLGIIASGQDNADTVLDRIKATKNLTSKPFGVNISLLSESAEAVAQLVIEEKISVVTCGGGNPSKYLPAWKKAGIKVLSIVPTVSIAKKMADAGADILIAEGMESGGHIGNITTMALVPQICSAVNLPVIAAGGIADGRGMAAAVMLGASGVQLGTRFLVAKECNVHANYKQQVLEATDTSTVVTGASVGSSFRVIKNTLANKFLTLERSGASSDEIHQAGIGALRRASQNGDMENGSVSMGQIAGLVNEEQTCAEIIDDLMQGYKATLQETLLFLSDFNS